MLYRFKTRLRRANFYRATSAILSTPPMPIVNAPWRIVSMVSNHDVQMYILALKSFYSRLGSGSVTAIVDRDMPGEARETLSFHFPGIEFTVLEDIQTAPCQRGGTWERLLYLIDRSQQEYAIQLDADTLTFGEIPEVKHCVFNNIAFTLNGATGPEKNLRPSDQIMPMSDIVADARSFECDYIGIVAERRFDEFAGKESFNYVRGSSGFVGLARNGVTRALVEHFHAEGERMHGKRWTEWGTEQSASNFAVANSPGAVVLPYPRYGNFEGLVHPESAFLHFIGSSRYVGGHFAALAHQVIASLTKNAVSAA